MNPCQRLLNVRGHTSLQIFILKIFINLVEKVGLCNEDDKSCFAAAGNKPT